MTNEQEIFAMLADGWEHWTAADWTKYSAWQDEQYTELQAQLATANQQAEALNHDAKEWMRIAGEFKQRAEEAKRENQRIMSSYAHPALFQGLQDDFVAMTTDRDSWRGDAKALAGALEELDHVPWSASDECQACNALAAHQVLEEKGK